MSNILKQVTIWCQTDGTTRTDQREIIFNAENLATRVTINFGSSTAKGMFKHCEILMGKDKTQKLINFQSTDDTVSFLLDKTTTKSGYTTIQPFATELIEDDLTKKKVYFAHIKLEVKKSLNLMNDDSQYTSSMLEDLVKKINVKAVNVATLDVEETPTVAITQEFDGLTFDFELPQIGDTLDVKSVTATTLLPSEPATANVVREVDGLTFEFGVPQGIQGEPGYTPIKGTDYFDGAKGDKGDKGNQWRGAYSSVTAYVVDDVVSYNGSSYICILASTNNLPTNTTYWSLFAQAGDVTSGQLATKVDKLMATNLVTNGDFNGTTGWVAGGSVLSALNNILSVVGNGTNTRTNTTQNTGIAPTTKTLFIRARVRVTNALCSTLGIRFNGLTSGTTAIVTQSNPVANQWYTLFATGSIAGLVGNAVVNCYADYVDSATANGKVMEVQYVIANDLTTLFGAGKEPSALEMDNLLANFPNSWFNGTQELINYRQLYLAKANKVQEAWITATLLNGWVNFDAVSYEPCQYFKDQMGIVHVKGFVKSGTIGQTIFNLPVGYRPSSNNYFTAYSNDALAQITLGLSGDLKCRIGNNIYVAFYIHFRGEL